MNLDFTKEELDALKFYKSENNYEAINQLLVSNCESDIALLSEGVEKNVIYVPYDRESVINNLNRIKLLYTLCLKYFYKTKHKKEVFYRGTNLSEVDRLRIEPFIDRMWSTTKLQSEAENIYASSWERPVGINIYLEENVPFIDVDEVLGLKQKTNEIIIAPFTKIKSIEEEKSRDLDGTKLFKSYNIVLEKQDLDELSETERKGLYSYILENSYSIKRKLEECINLENENTINYENIRKLEQLLVKYETAMEEKEASKEYSDLDRNSDYSDIERITKELEQLKRITTNVFEIRKDNINFVNMWKRNIAVYMIAECKEIEREFEGEEIKFYNEEEIKNLPKIEPQEVKVEEKKVDDNTIIIDTDIQIQGLVGDDNPLHARVKEESQENIEAVKKLLDDIAKLITKQQNHAKIAGNMGSNYCALNNAFEMRKVSENLLDLVQQIDSKIKDLCQREENDKIELQLELISKSNIEISTLLNYLNNPKFVTRDSKASRFDEMAIIEENELKRGIAEKIRYIRGEAELKKLKDDLEIIEEKGRFSRFIGLFTGKNKLDEVMIEQIEIRKNAIRKTLSKKLNLAYNYSIHELMAEITMFIDENEDDELIAQEVIDLKALAAELRKNYVILESKVQSVVEEREGRNLPLDKRMTKIEIIEAETYKFLKKYKYDMPEENNSMELNYQDTMANEIGRIVEYINTAKIL